VEGTLKHVGQLEAPGMQWQKTGKDREELKCRYPRQMIRKWMQWVLQVGWDRALNPEVQQQGVEGGQVEHGMVML